MAAERHAELVVIGGGAMGLSTAWWAASRARVVVLERFELGHNRGASHGGERIFRHAHVDPAYVAMALSAEEGWLRLEHDAGRRLLHRVGCVEHGEDAALDELARVAGRLGVTTERLPATAAARRWPGLRFTTDVLVQPAGGWLRAADAIECLAARASAGGAELRFGVPVVQIEAGGSGVRVEAGDEVYVAPAAVVNAGAWTADLVQAAGLPGLPPLTTTEEHVFFFARRPGSAAHSVPPFIHWEDVVRYGLPAVGGLVKVGEHHTGDVISGDERTFTTEPVRVERMERYVADWLPGLVPQAVESTTCLYTSTPGHDFVIDRLGPIVVGAGFSGQGFKFVPEVGRRLAAMALDDASPAAAQPPLP
jgi:sarcosine oxidase